MPLLLPLLLLLLLQADQRVEYEETMSRIKTTTRIADAHDCDLIIEAIIENKDIKVDFYNVIILALTLWVQNVWGKNSYLVVCAEGMRTQKSFEKK